MVRLWQRFAAGDGRLVAVVFFRRWSPHGGGPPTNEVCLWHWFASGDGVGAEVAQDSGLFMAVVEHDARASLEVEQEARAVFGSV